MAVFSSVLTQGQVWDAIVRMARHSHSIMSGNQRYMASLHARRAPAGLNDTVLTLPSAPAQPESASGHVIERKA